MYNDDQLRNSIDRTSRFHMALKLADLSVKLFTDGADKAQILEMAKQPWIKGFTTVPSLMKAARVSEYESYARGLVTAVPYHHISFEVFSDNIPETIGQARRISEWGPTHIDRN